MHQHPEWDEFELIDDINPVPIEHEQPLLETVYFHDWNNISTRDYPDVTIAEYTSSSTAQRYYNANTYAFVSDIKKLRDSTNATAINFRATVVDPSTNYQSDITLRIETDDDSLDYLPQHIEHSTALPYAGNDTHGGSDNVTDMIVIWHLGWVQLITQKESDGVVTTVVGSTTILPGYVTKVINSLDHGVVYSNVDCMFECLNEALCVRYNPCHVRAYVFGGLPSNVDKNRILIDIRRHLKLIAAAYRCNIAIHCLDDNTRLITSKDASIPTVHLIKMGMAIGIRDRTIPHVKATSDELELTAGDCSAYYDFETVSNSHATQAYSFSLKWTDNTTTTLVHHDEATLASSIVDILRRHMQSTPHVTTYLHAWNGSRFDHSILLRLCGRDFKIGFTIINNKREVLSSSLSTNGKTLVLRDPCKMFPGSLEEVAAIFNLEHTKLPFNHMAVEQAYLEGRLSELINTHHMSITEYVERDVQLLAQVTIRISAMYRETGINYNTCLTRSMASYGMWTKCFSDVTKQQLATVQFCSTDTLRFSHEEIDMDRVRSEAIAGRCQAIRGEYSNVILLDFRSMYPSVAMHESFPCGNYFPTATYVPNKLGLYLVNIHSQPHPCVIPYRKKQMDSYDWTGCEKIVGKLVTSVDVQCLIECNATFEILDGVCWTDSCNYFSEHMGKMIECRRLTKSAGNVAMSEHYKHMANSLTGSIFQQLRREYVRVFPNQAESSKYLKMYGKYIKVVHECMYGDEQVMLYFYPMKLTNARDIEVQRQVCGSAMGSKPVILTMFIYAYARAKLWRLWNTIELSGVGKVVYCDTDSLAVMQQARVDNALAYMIGRMPGQLDIVMNNAEAVIVHPKVYAMRTVDCNTNKTVERVRAKGMDREGVVCMFQNNKFVTSLLKLARQANWDDARNTYNSVMLKNGATTKLCYDTIRHVHNGGIAVCVYWYFKRTDEGIKKVYATKVLKA